MRSFVDSSGEVIRASQQMVTNVLHGSRSGYLPNSGFFNANSIREQNVKTKNRGQRLFLGDCLVVALVVIPHLYNGP